ncbi:tyrosine-type recombinase/integrase [Streptosporangium sp. NPDC000239]|uniref:tyrosine-type recombinase/integrase n=1 Tax=Streptosporangium sp. NPDC000239 TaxID=3154248 RepID=UPI00332CE734
MTENVIEFDPSRRRPRRSRRPAPSEVVGADLEGLIDSWKRALEAGNKAAYTIYLYTRSARAFYAYLCANGHPHDAEGVTAEHVRGFLASEQDRTSVHTSSAHHSYLGVFFNWLISEEERTTFSPVRRGDRPHVTKKARKYLPDEEIAALLAACKGAGFAERRDTAMIMILVDNGVRASGLAGILLENVDLKNRRILIVLKGGDEHWIPIGAKTVAALDRYLRVRAKHKWAGSPYLWLGVRSKTMGKMTRAGVALMLSRRGEQAGVENVHPHRFRGTAAHLLLEAGMDPDSVRRVLGWKSYEQMRHYTEELADDRARATHTKFAPGDRF